MLLQRALPKIDSASEAMKSDEGGDVHTLSLVERKENCRPIVRSLVNGRFAAGIVVVLFWVKGGVLFF